MNEIRTALMNAWNRFWFSKEDPLICGLIRLLGGAILFYTHLVWTFEFNGFFSSDQLLSTEHNELITNSWFAWSHFHWIDSLPLLWGIHIVVLVVMMMFCLGLFTRVTSIVSLLFAISYANRAVGATFGLDQINIMLCFYCAIGPAGAALSIDRWWSGKPAERSVSANLAMRMIQVHLCIIYLFAGWSKLMGSSWWTGEAIWGALANAEYQTIDMTWMAAYPAIVNLVTHVSLFWEASYAFLVWPRWTRPAVIAMAIFVHLGIGLAMGMLEFGLVMVTANLAFVTPSFMRKIGSGLAGSTKSAGGNSLN